MRAAITFLMAALFLVATTIAGLANGKGGPHNYHFPPVFHFPPVVYNPGHGGPPPHHNPPPHHHPPIVCEIVIIKIPKWTYASWGHHRRPHVTYIIIKKIYCHPPFST
jgi:hypothetical protein